MNYAVSFTAPAFWPRSLPDEDGRPLVVLTGSLLVDAVVQLRNIARTAPDQQGEIDAQIETLIANSERFAERTSP